MTEHERLPSTDPATMLAFLKGKASQRKLRLFAVSCCRHFWTVATHDDEAVLGVAEMFAEGEADEQHLAEARRRVQSGYNQNNHFHYGPVMTAVRAGYEALLTAFRAGPAPPLVDAHSLVVSAYWTGPEGYDRANINARYYAREVERTRQVATVCCVFGNLFRPASLDPAILTWNNATVVRLAQAAYEERQMPEGTLDNGRLAVLSDALEEAGCTDTDILGHLRGSGPHVRGCWVIDLLLGKS